MTIFEFYKRVVNCKTLLTCEILNRGKSKRLIKNYVKIQEFREYFISKILITLKSILNEILLNIFRCYKNLNDISLIEHQKKFYQKKNYSIIGSHVRSSFETGFSSKQLDTYFLQDRNLFEIKIMY